jgi:hypothetical protein
MTNPSESPLDRLWREYSSVFEEFDDLTLGRWLCQTLGQLDGRVWRMSHPLVGAYRLAAQVAHNRQIWLKRLATPPLAYSEAPCCRSPLLPVFTRDILETGLSCPHCSGTAVSVEDLPADLQPALKKWAEDYQPVHDVAHWDDRKKKTAPSYEVAFENAAEEAEKLLAVAGSDLVPQLSEFYPAIIWEDHDECLEVRPEDIEA